MNNRLMEVRRRRAGDPLHSRRPRSSLPKVDLEPASTYEVVTRQMVESLADDLREIKGRLNGLLWMIAGAMVLEIALRLMGAT
ncbi:MAG TPA: hypothetical protein VFL82_10525 [Thermomicrobiales bacterium]|nr:hypothetical protein [Thermomicrobiales bacterium]